MALTKEVVILLSAVMKNDFLEKGWNAYTIGKQHPISYSRIAVYNLVKKIKETGSGKRRKGSGRLLSATSEQIADYCELSVYSQKESPATNFSIRKIGK